MKYSINWLKKLSGTKWTTEELVDNLTMRAFEVEKEEFDVPAGVIVGKILEIKKHPNADKLQIVKIAIGNNPSLLTSLPKGERKSKNELSIVCGAPNIQVGQLVPVALLGTVLPNGLEIKEAEIRGVKSYGMLCAPDELGLGKDHSGIFILGDKARVAQSLQEYLENQEKTLEIKVLPDRAHDALSHVGMAREIGVLEAKKIDYDWEGLVLPGQKSKELKVEIKDDSLCPRYIGMVVKGVEVKESPEWIKEKLRDCGLRPINNIVDATNLIMLELGNPIHAFDLEQLKSKNLQIIVRKAKKGEEIILLDGEKKILDENDLVIANSEKVLALAGIKGGLNSGITEKTRDLVIEVANFDAVSIRKTRTKLGLMTDASFRYEKDIDPNLCEKAAVRVLEIIQNIAGGKLEGSVDKYSRKAKPRKVELSWEYAKNLLGEEISEKQVEKTLHLSGIGFKKDARKKSWICEIPTIRIDLKTPEDLIEEIGRIWGYEHIRSQAIQTTLRPMKLSPLNDLSRKLRRELVALGFSEVYNYSFYGEKEKEALGLKEAHFEIENAVSPEERYFQASLVPNLLKNVALNLNNFSRFSIFETGKAYEKKGEKAEEKYLIGGALVREETAPEETFREIKGILESLGNKLGLTWSWEKNRGRVDIRVGKNLIGKLEMIGQDVWKKLDIKRFSGSLWIFELDVGKILENRKETKVFEELPRFPKAPRDISFLVPENARTPFADIERMIKEKGGLFLENLELFDIWKTDGKTSYAVHLEFMSKERTLEHEEVENELKKITEALEKEGFEMRK